MFDDEPSDKDKKTSAPPRRSARKTTMKARERYDKMPTIKKTHGGDAKSRSNFLPLQSEHGSVGRRNITSADKAKWERVTLRVRQVPGKAHSQGINAYGDKNPRGKWDLAIGDPKQNAIGHFADKLGQDSKEVSAVYSASEQNLGNSIAICLDYLEDQAAELEEEDSAAAEKLYDLIERVEAALEKADARVDNKGGGKYTYDQGLIKELEEKLEEFKLYGKEGEEECKSIQLLMTYIKMPSHASNWRLHEWLHTVADSLGGPVANWNGASGSYAANTQMAAIENLIKNQPGIGVEVTAYSLPGNSGQRIATWYEYTVIAHDPSGKPTSKITFEVDAQRTHYSQLSVKRDQDIVKEFLETTKNDRIPNPKKPPEIPDLTLPEVVAISPSHSLPLQVGSLYPQTKIGKEQLTSYNSKPDSALAIKKSADRESHEQYLKLTQVYNSTAVKYNAALASCNTVNAQTLMARYSNPKHPKHEDSLAMGYDSSSEQMAGDSDDDEMVAASASKKKPAANPDASGGASPLVDSLNSSVAKTKTFGPKQQHSNSASLSDAPKSVSQNSAKKPKSASAEPPPSQSGSSKMEDDDQPSASAGKGFSSSS